ncbi:MAG: autotransporter outer membrane beta-barrel domain-containing protein [Hyphomicrobiaceae bacterium]|nr:autotransporter outer membrane beta-barrel domain-containing protein [Hyphomicrobiaceae bacterium]
MSNRQPRNQMTSVSSAEGASGTSSHGLGTGQGRYGIRRAGLILGVSALAMALAWSDAARAQSVWQGDTDTDYSTGTNWDTNAVPGAADNVQIGAGAPADPTLSAAETANNVDVLAGGTLTVTAAGTLNAATITTAVGGTIDNSGTLNSAAALVNAGTLTNANIINAGIDNSGNATNSGTVASLINTAGTFGNTGIVAGTADVSGGAVTNDVGGSIGGTSTVTGGTLTNNGGTLAAVDNQAGGTFDNTSGNAGAVTNAGTATNAGTVASLVNTGGTFGNTGTITGAVDNSADLTTSGTISGGLTNTGTVNAQGTINGVIANNAGGVMTVTGVIAGDNTFTNAAGAQLDVTGGNFTGITTLMNNNIVNIAAGRTLAADTINNNAGSISIGNGATLQGTGNTLNNAATINVATGGTVTDAGAINNLATGIINFNGPGGTATLASGGGLDITNDGAINVVSGDVDLTSGNLIVQGAGGVLNVTGGNMTVTAGVENNGTAAAGITIGAGRTLAAATVTNAAGATIANSGNLTSGAVVANSGTINNLLAASVIDGGVNNLTAGSVLTNVGTVNGGVTNAGTVNSNTATSVINGGLISTAGAVNAAGQVNGAIDNSGTSVFTVTGNLTGDNTFTNGGTAQLVVSGGNFTGITALANNSTNATGVDIAATRLLSAASVSNGAGATIRNAGTLTSGAVIQNSGTINNSTAASIVNGGVNNLTAGSLLTNVGTVNGGVTNAGTVNSNTATSVINGGLINTGTVNAAGQVNGAIANNAGSFTVTGALTGNNTFTNAGGATLNVNGGDFTGLTSLGNTGTINLADTRALTTAGTITNNAGGAINLTGTTATVSTLANAGTVNMTNGAINSVLNVGGNYSATAGVINLDVDLSATNSAAQRGDRLVATGTTSGTTTLNFTNIGTKGYFANAINVVTDTGTTANFTTTGLERNLLVIYTFQRSGNNWQIVSSLDAAGAGVAASSVSSALTSISTGFTEAASAFISQPADPKVNQLSFGIWSRGKAGQYDISSRTSTLKSAANSRWESTLAGYQIGADGGIFDINGSGFNLHFGLTGGTVVVKGKDAKFAGMSKTDAEAPFFGFYTALTGHGYFADLQVQRNYYDMALLNPTAGFNNAQVGGAGYTVVGSLGKQFVIGESSFIEPSIGLNWSRIKVEDVGIAGIGVVRTNDIESTLGSFRLRAGTAFQATENLVLQPTVTASIWHEFSGNSTGSFISAGGTETITSTRVGTFGQVGAGVTAQSLNSGLLGFVRADYRFGQNINGVAVNAGIRYQF